MRWAAVRCCGTTGHRASSAYAGAMPSSSRRWASPNAAPSRCAISISPHRRRGRDLGRSQARPDDDEGRAVITRRGCGPGRVRRGATGNGAGRMTIPAPSRRVTWARPGPSSPAPGAASPMCSTRPRIAKRSPVPTRTTTPLIRLDYPARSARRRSPGDAGPQPWLPRRWTGQTVPSSNPRLYAVRSPLTLGRPARAARRPGRQGSALDGKVRLHVPNGVYSRAGQGWLLLTAASTNACGVPAVSLSARPVRRK